MNICFASFSFPVTLTPFMVVHFILRLLYTVQYHLYSAMLFTWTDYKTIFFPITVFACATAPVRSFSNLFHCCLWVWFHQLLCNVSNQARSRDEDNVNRPWRPLPSGRITEPQAMTLRWSIVVFCMFFSSIYDQDLVLTTMGLVATTFTYDELGAAGNVVGKALCTAAGYVAFEVGATTIVGANHTMDFVSVTAVTISGILIFTAIQAQDFPDVEGDKAVGRMTFPIYAPELSRLLTLLATVTWSVFLSWFWGIGPLSTAVFISFGIHVGLRYYCWRTLEADKRSYLLFNVWLMAAHVLPLHARTSVLAL